MRPANIKEIFRHQRPLIFNIKFKVIFSFFNAARKTPFRAAPELISLPLHKGRFFMFASTLLFLEQYDGTHAVIIYLYVKKCVNWVEHLLRHPVKNHCFILYSLLHHSKSFQTSVFFPIISDKNLFSNVSVDHRLLLPPQNFSILSKFNLSPTYLIKPTCEH